MVRVESDTESDEIVNPLKTLTGLDDKAGIMLDMIKSNQVEKPAIGITRLLVRFYFRNVFSNGGIKGLDNLQRAITTAETENKRLIFTPAHVADADHPVAIYLMAKERRGSKIQDELVWMGGINMLRRPSIRWLMRAEHLIYNVTPRDMNHLQILQERRDEFDEEKIKILGEIRQTFNQMREKAWERILETCVRGGKPLVVYIEGGRSYDGLLKKPLEDFSRLFPRDDSAIVVPYRVYGSREFNPPGEDPKYIRKELMPGDRHKQKVSMVVGESYPSSEIWAVWRKRREGIGRGADRKINPMEWVMANIATLDLEHARLEDRPLYIGLMERFAPERIAA